jgi:CheY-like chemotaxis protein
MSIAYLIIEIIIAAVFAVLTIAFSEKFIQAGFRRWGWILAGFILVFAGAVIESAFMIRSFAQLFIPSVGLYAAGIGHVLSIAGLLMIFITFFISTIMLYRQKMQDQQRQDSFKLLDIIRETATQSISLIELVNFSIRELVRGTGSNAGCILIYNPNRKQLVLAAHRDLPRRLEQKLERIEDPGSIFFRTQKSSRPHVVGNIANADRITAEMLSDSDFRSLVTVPLVGRTGSFGVAALFSEDSYFYGNEMTQLVSSAANILGPAVASLRLEREMRDLKGDVKKAKKSQQFISSIFEISARAGKPEAVLRSLHKYALEHMSIQNTEIFQFVQGQLSRIFPHAGLLGQTDPLFEHIKRSILDNKSLLIRTESNGDVERTLIIPIHTDRGEKLACIFEIDPQSQDLKQDDLERIRILARAMDLQLKLIRRQSETAVTGGYGSLEMEELNNLNNILTGILGNAQLTSVNLKKENFPGKLQIGVGLEKIVQEASDAGERIKQLQEKLVSRPASSEKKNSLSTAFGSMILPNRMGGDSSFHLKENPSIKFNFMSSQNGVLALPLENVRAILARIFAWLEYEWQPESPLSVKVIDSEHSAYFIVSDYSFGNHETDFSTYEFRPLRLFPDRSIAGLAEDNINAEYYQEKSDKGHLLILRFPSEVKSRPESERRSERPRILAIDDQEMIRELFASMLGELKYPHLICEDGNSGLNVFDSGDFDIVITDLGLPDIEGWEVARRVKELKPGTPVIVITGWGVNSEQIRRHQDLADFILAKPFRMEQLEETIKKAENLELTGK